MNHSAKFWDKIAERYSKHPIADKAAYQKKLQVTQENFKPNSSVLEFGCGDGIDHHHSRTLCQTYSGNRCLIRND